MRGILIVGLLIAFSAGDAAGLTRSGKAASCGIEPEGLQGFDPEITACWHDAASPAAALGYTPSREPGPGATAASWAQLQQLVTTAKGALHVRLSGSLTVSSRLAINSKQDITVSGPAKITCSSDRPFEAVIISRSSGIVLRDLTFVGCSNSAVIVNATVTGAPKPITATGAGTAPPDVLLQGINIQNCSSERGGGVAVIGSRVVLQDSVLQHNIADGCGGGVYAENSSLLVTNTIFRNNLANNTVGDDSCRGGALHAQRTWLAVTRSSFIRNRGVNGSAVLLVLPVGVAQLQDSTFEDNHPRPGVSQQFPSSSGAVTVLGGGVPYIQPTRGPPGSGAACTPVTEGLAVVRCNFRNNSASLTGGEGGAMSGYEVFIAVINTTVVGTPPLRTTNTPTITPRSVAAAATGRGQRKNIVFTAYMGGCVLVEAGSFLVSGSDFSHCNARFVGGGMSLLAVTTVVQDSTFSNNFGDMGGGIRSTNGYLSMSNVSVLNNQGLSTAAGIYLESNELADVHLERMNVHHNALTGRGGGLLAEMVDEQGKFYLSVHDSNFTYNTGTYGAALCLYSLTQADVRNSFIAHNTALKFGGGMECAKFYGEDDKHLTSIRNTWFNNTALIRGGGVITHPCNLTSYRDKFLANRAAQEGGGLMLYGGENVRVQNARVSCNTAQKGAGVMVKLSDNGVESHLTMTCSEVTANGGSNSPVLQDACVSTLSNATRKGLISSKAQTILAALAAGTSSSAGSSRQATSGAEKGGGVYVAYGQSANIFNSTIDGNTGSSSGGGIYMDQGSMLKLAGVGGSVSYNNCTGGSGGALFMEKSTKLTASDVTWSNNQGMFGGAIFALGNGTEVKLADVLLSNNTAAAGGAVASLGGSSIACSGGCEFKYNRAKVGGALMLHSGSVTLNGTSLLANTAAATTGTAAIAATGAASGTASETIQYMLGLVQVSAGGAVYVWKGQLELNRCNIVSNVAWGTVGRGGGVYVDDSQLTVVNSNLTRNWATAAGGAVLLGPTGSNQRLDARGSRFEGNAAGQYGGAVAAGLLLPGDAAVAAAKSRGSAAGSESQWTVLLDRTAFVSNTAGRQGGAVACSLCDRLAISAAVFQQNSAVQTGGGVSCVGCGQMSLNSSSFSRNTAASGGGACILAAGNGSLAQDTDFIGNAAGTGAAAAGTKLLDAAMGAAAATAGPAAAAALKTALTAGSNALPTAQQALPACGVVGSGGGLCLGLWETKFVLKGSGNYVNNSAYFGAGLFIEACPAGEDVCPVVLLNPNLVTFHRNILADDVSFGAQDSGSGRHLLQMRAAAAAAGVYIGSGADLYVTNVTVLLEAGKNASAGARSKQKQRAATAADVVEKLSSGTVKAQTAAAAGRNLLSPTLAAISTSGSSGISSSNLLSAAQQLAAALQPKELGESGIRLAMATGPSQLGPIVSAGNRSAIRSNLTSNVTVILADSGRLQKLSLPVLDQLKGQVADDVAEQLSVQAEAAFGNCTACQLSGISKVLPINGTAQFDQLQLQAQPGSNQTITFKLLSALEGTELKGGSQTLTVWLQSCHWGQATTAVGCVDCTSPLFSFSPTTSKCSICPGNTKNCSSTTLLPDSGYWNSGPLSTRMHKCPRRIACLRNADAEVTLQCLQQQQLMLNNPEYVSDSLTDSITGVTSAGKSNRLSTPWDDLRAQCIPVLKAWADKAAAAAANSSSSGRHLLQAAASSNASISLMSDPYLNSTEVIGAAYGSLMCAQGYTGRLCTRCIFPGSKAEGPYGHFHSGCGRCPSWTTSLSTYVMSRVFDIGLVGVLILTTLVEMKKRRAAVHQARKQALSKLTSSVGAAGSTAAAAANGSSAISQQGTAATQAGQQQAVAAATGSGGSAAATATAADPHCAASMWASGAAALDDCYDDAPLPPLDDHHHHQQQQQQQGVPSQQQGVHQPMQQQLSKPVQTEETLQDGMSQQPSGAPYLATLQSLRELEIQGSINPEQPDPKQQQQQQAPLAAAVNSHGPFAAATSPFAAAATSSVFPAAASTAVPAAAPAAATAVRQRRRPLRRGPLFAREVTSRAGRHVINYSPAQLTTVELFEVFKDFLQVLSILQAVLLGWQSAAAAALAAVSITPMSTTAWISLDCILPRTDYVALMLPFYQIAASLLLPLSYAVLLMVLWLCYAASFSLRTHQPFWRMTVGKRLKAPIISSLLVLLSFFYPSLAYTILGVFSCRYLDPSNSSTVPGEVLGAQGWYWTADLDRQCFVDPGHRALALGLGIPGTLLLLAYPIVQGVLLAQQAKAGQLTPTSNFFADYGHLVEDFRPRLFYWGSIVELRKLVLVAVVLGLASTGVISQLVGCSLVLLGFCAATMGLLPYPYRLLNRLHLGSAGVLLAVVWLNLFVAVGEEGGMLSGGISAKHSLTLQLLSVVLVILMIMLLLSMCAVRLYRKVRDKLDVDGDGKISLADIRALLAKFRSKRPQVANKLLPCFKPSKGQKATP